MRTHQKTTLLLILFLFSAARAQAGTLTSASWITDLDFGPFVPFTPIAVPIAATGSSTAGSIAVSLGVPQLSVQTFLPRPASTGIDFHVRFTLGGVQHLTATPGMAAADQAVPGTVILMTAFNVIRGANQSMFIPGAITLLEVPLSIGKSGRQTHTTLILGVTHTVTVDYYDWSAGSRIFTGLTSKNVALPDVVAMGSFALSGMGAGTVTLVSPTRLSLDGSVGQRRTVSLTTLKLSFVPEPSVLLLAAAAAAAMVARRRPH